MCIYEIESTLSNILNSLFDEYDTESINKLSYIDLFYLYSYIYIYFNVKLKIQDITENNLTIRSLSKHIYDESKHGD